MSNDGDNFAQSNIRGTDSNSLLRLYDRAKEIVHQSPSRQERTRAERALRRIAKELEKRKILFKKGDDRPVFA